MTNLEFYSDAIMGIIEEHSDIAIVDNKPEACTGQCEKCSRNEHQCDDVSLMTWLMANYCPFKEGEVIEVRDCDEHFWKLDIFDHMSDNGSYMTKSGSKWVQARLYGSFGKEQENERQVQNHPDASDY